jgi:hypothetical protein
MLNEVMLNVVMLSVVMLSVVMLSVVMLSVVANCSGANHANLIYFTIFTLPAPMTATRLEPLTSRCCSAC